MKTAKISIAASLLLTLLTVSCSRGGKAVKVADEADSIAYVIGLNVGRNLYAMDSTMRPEAVCRAIMDVFKQRQLMTNDEAQAFYLRFVNYTKGERIRAYESQFLEDFANRNRSFARTDSGLTYAVDEVGDTQLTPKSDRDSVALRYRAKTMEGREFDSSYERGDTLKALMSDLLPGLREGLKLIGRGGRMKAWLPAALAYGSGGADSLGIGANYTLYYEVELIDVVPQNRQRNRR